jgi:signal transduction histidine kinase
MNAFRSLFRRTRIRTKILVPTIVLFTIFALAVIVNFTWTYTARVETRVAQQLQRDGVLLDKLLRDREERIALHARFMADMVQFSEQFSGTATGRSILIYLLEYLQHEQVETHIYSRADQQTEPYGELVRKGLLGIRTTSLTESGDGSQEALTIASVSPIERTGRIGEVVVTTLSLNAERLNDFKDKMGADLGVIHEGRMVTSTLTDPACREVVDQRIDVELQDSVLREGESVIRNIDCQRNPQKAIFRPLEIGFENKAIYVLSVPLGDIFAARREVLRDTVVTAALVLVAVTLIYSVLVRKITQPLKDLSSVTMRVGERDFRPQIEVTSQDEVGDLASSFNSMFERLEANEQEIERLHKKEMERADRLATIGELASGVAHEIRNPLAGISGAMRVLKKEKALSANRKELLDEVLRQIERMDKMTRDLLDYSRRSSAKLKPSSMNKILDNALYLTPFGREGSQFSIRKEFDSALPDVLADYRQVQQVFLNILINSIQATGDDGEITIKTAVRDEGGHRWAVVEISDNGVGMSPAILDKAVRPFFTTKQEGTGLGLSIAQQIMRNHRGKMEIESKLGKGTKFSLLFPL